MLQARKRLALKIAVRELLRGVPTKMLQIQQGCYLGLIILWIQMPLECSPRGRISTVNQRNGR